MKNLTFALWCLSLMIALSCKPDKPLIPACNRAQYKIIHEPPMTLENIYSYLCDLEVKYPDIVIRQCILETGWLTSYNCQTRFNLYGMKGGEVTESNPNGYAIYKNWKHSCRAYCRWQRHWYGDSTQDYYQFLSNIGYAESPTYIDKLKSIKLIIVKR